MARPLLALASLSLICLSLACGGATIDPATDGPAPSPTTPPTSSTAPSRVDPPTPEVPADDVSCGSERIDLPLVPLDVVGDDAPAPFGGAVAPGVYRLVEARVHTGANGPSASSAVRVGSKLRVAERLLDFAYEIVDSPGHAPRTIHFIADYQVKGTSLALATRCVGGDEGASIESQQVIGFSSHGQGDLTLYMAGSRGSGSSAISTYLYMR